MAHITSIGAGMFTDLSVAHPTNNITAATIETLKAGAASGWNGVFASEIAAVGGVRATNTFVRFPSIREFPGVGTPPNIVNVPIFGSKITAQIQGQADAPSLELTLNYVGDVWAKETGAHLGLMVGDGISRVFRLALLNTEPTGTGGTKYASTAAGLGTVPNSIWYFIAKIEALLVTPQLTDANQATLTLTAQSDFYGAFTV